MSPIHPYTISIPESKLHRVQRKLDLVDFPDKLDDAGWDYGAPLADIKRLTTYWKEHYDWRKHEAQMNELPNFHTEIQVEGFEALDIHFLHQRSGVEGAVPLLFCHGWPGSFLEITKLLPLLADTNGKDTPAFHIVAPSLPNYGFSSRTKKKGFSLPQYAETCHQLMLKLGYDQYVSQGGDWGTRITRTLALLHPTHLRATHINMIPASPPTFTKHPYLYTLHALIASTAQETAGHARSTWFAKEGSGYKAEQGTKPQTLGYSLTDSPIGLLAWIYEKLHDWTDGYPWSEDEILTWVCIYLFSTAGPAASLRIYYEALHDKGWGRARTEGYIPDVKLGLSYFPKEITVVPMSWGRTLGPVVYEKRYERGGHFAAWERPEAVVGDLRAMFGKGGGAYGCVEGREGYVRGREVKL